VLVLVIVIGERIACERGNLDYDYEYRCAEHEHERRLSFVQRKKRPSLATWMT